MEQKLDEFAIKVRREYYRKWRAANKEKVRQHNRYCHREPSAEVVRVKLVAR